SFGALISPCVRGLNSAARVSKRRRSSFSESSLRLLTRAVLYRTSIILVITVPTLLCKHLQNRIAAKVRQPLVAPAVIISQPPLIQSHRLQDRRVYVVNRIRLDLGLVAVFVRRADHLPPFHASAGEPHREAARVR